MEKDKNYFELIAKIVEYKNEISDVQSNDEDCFEVNELESYVSEGYVLIEDTYRLLTELGFSRDEIDFDVEHF